MELKALAAFLRHRRHRAVEVTDGPVAGTELHRMIARETAIGVVITTLVSTLPGLLFADTGQIVTLQAVEVVAVGLVPQFFMNGLMSALVPSLRLWRTQRREHAAFAKPAIALGRIAIVALMLATVSTILGLALIHLLVAPFAPLGLRAGATLALRGAQGALAAATVTPVALALLSGPVGRLLGSMPNP